MTMTPVLKLIDILLLMNIMPMMRIFGQQKHNKNNFYHKNKRAVTIPINGLVPERYFAIHTPVGDSINCNYDKNRNYSHIDEFLQIIPPE